MLVDQIVNFLPATVGFRALVVYVHANHDCTIFLYKN